MTWLLLVFYLIVPAGVIWLCRKVPFLNKIGPILLLYIFGIIVGNTVFDLKFIDREALASLQNLLTTAIIPIAIPMLLFNSNFKRFSLKTSLLALVSGLIAVCITVVAGFFIFRDYIGPDPEKIAGLMTGVYTGGTPNMAALQLMLGVKEETYILLTTYDMIASFSYLIFLMVIGIRMFRAILPKYKRKEGTSSAGAGANIERESYRGIFKWKNMRQILLALGVSVISIIIAFGITYLVSGGIKNGIGAVMDGKYFMAIFILLITTLGIGASFLKPVQKLKKSYEGGMYLIYIFCFVIATMADISNLDLKGGLYMLLYMFFIAFVSLFIQTLLSKLMKIDADTMIISSVALINSPPFVPMMSMVMKNRDMLIPGLTIGVVGYAAGNYLGFILAELLKLF